MSRSFLTLLIYTVLVIIGCNDFDSSVPILGEIVYDENTGESRTYRAPKFDLINQNGKRTSNAKYNQKVYVADFFFTSCPTICPKMTDNLKSVSEVFLNDNTVGFLSFSIDPKRDTPERLRVYIDNYNLNDQHWDFLTGDKESIYELAKDYKVSVFDDGTPEREDILHDGTFVLVDGIGQIRGYYNGLDKEDMKRLINDIRKIKNE